MEKRQVSIFMEIELVVYSDAERLKGERKLDVSNLKHVHEIF